jgi:hypothetical protein
VTSGDGAVEQDTQRSDFAHMAAVGPSKRRVFPFGGLMTFTRVDIRQSLDARAALIPAAAISGECVRRGVP